MQTYKGLRHSTGNSNKKNNVGFSITFDVPFKIGDTNKDKDYEEAKLIFDILYGKFGCGLPGTIWHHLLAIFAKEYENGCD